MTAPVERILLLNPPAASPVFRDGYCSGQTKGTFFIPPLDLQIQSGFFHQAGWTLAFLDAVFERLTASQTLARIKAFAPTSILALTGAATLAEDRAFFQQVKAAQPDARLFLSGDVARFHPSETLRALPEAEGLLADFGSPGLRDYLAGGPARDLHLRQTPFATAVGRAFEYPLPWRGCSQQYPYALPFFAAPRYYSLCAGFGCPYQCQYCNTHLLGYRPRPMDAFIAELRLAAELGFQSLYIRDATFMVGQARTQALFQAWEQTGLRFEWMCFTRPDLLDEALVAQAARLGCRLMLLGVESFDERWLAEMSKPIQLSVIQTAVRRLHCHGIRVAVELMAGMESAAPDAPFHAGLRAYEQTLLRFLDTLQPDYISVNVFARRPGLETVEHPLLRRAEAEPAACAALAARLTRAFYFQPRRMAQHLSFIRTPAQFSLAVRTVLRLAGR